MYASCVQFEYRRELQNPRVLLVRRMRNLWLFKSAPKNVNVTYFTVSLQCNQTWVRGDFWQQLPLCSKLSHMQFGLCCNAKVNHDKSYSEKQAGFYWDISVACRVRCNVTSQNIMFRYTRHAQTCFQMNSGPIRVLIFGFLRTKCCHLIRYSICLLSVISMWVL